MRLLMVASSDMNWTDERKQPWKEGLNGGLGGGLTRCPASSCPLHSPSPPPPLPLWYDLACVMEGSPVGASHHRFKFWAKNTIWKTQLALWSYGNYVYNAKGKYVCNFFLLRLHMYVLTGWLEFSSTYMPREWDRERDCQSRRWSELCLRQAGSGSILEQTRAGGGGGLGAPQVKLLVLAATPFTSSVS